MERKNLKRLSNFPNYFLLLKMICNIYANMNDKFILISNIGLDLSGKRLVEVARKILGFNIIVLFFSSNKENLKWIKDLKIYMKNI